MTGDRARVAMTPHDTASYVLHDLFVDVHYADPSIAERCAPILAFHGLTPAPGGNELTWTLCLHETPDLPAAPPEAEESARHESGLRFLRDDDAHLYLSSDWGHAHVDPSRKQATAYVPPARDAGSGFDVSPYLLLTFTLLLILQRHGLYAMHAAALDADDAGGVLVIAESDSGKSTLTMRLLQQGWHLVSDDSVLLRAHADRVEVLPFRRDVALDPAAANLFPEIREHAEPFFTDRRKWRVDVDTLFPGQRAASCTPQLLLFPTITGRADTELASIGPMDALTRLMQEASFLTPDARSATKQLDALNALVHQSRAYQLLAGRDVRDEPGRASHLLAPLLQS